MTTISSSDRLRSRPERSFGLAFFVTGLAFTIVMAGTNIPSTLYGLYAARYSLSPLDITFVFATFVAGTLVALILFGRLSNDVGRRPVILGALGLSGVSAVLFLVADSVAVIFVGRFVTGLSAGLIVATGTVALVELAPSEKARQATLVAVSANLGGLGIGVFAGGVIASLAESKLRAPFWVDLAFVVAAFALVPLLVPETVAARRRPTLTLERPRIEPAARPVFASSMTAAAVGLGTMGLLISVSGLFLAGTLGYHSLVLAGVPGGSAFVCAALGQLIVRRLPQRRALPIAVAVILVAVGCLISALQTQTLAPLLVAAVLTGLGSGGAVGSGLPAVVALTSPPGRANATAAFFLVIYLAIGGAAVAVGFLIKATDLRTAGTIFASVGAVVIALVLISLARSGGDSPASGEGGVPDHQPLRRPVTNDPSPDSV
jgi:MFS family permease